MLNPPPLPREEEEGLALPDHYKSNTDSQPTITACNNNTCNKINVVVRMMFNFYNTRVHHTATFRSVGVSNSLLYVHLGGREEERGM